MLLFAVTSTTFDRDTATCLYSSRLTQNVDFCEIWGINFGSDHGDIPVSIVFMDSQKLIMCFDAVGLVARRASSL